MSSAVNPPPDHNETGSTESGRTEPGHHQTGSTEAGHNHSGSPQSPGQTNSGSSQRGVDQPVSQRVQPGLTRDEVVGRQKERFGGMKFGAAFFGWLTASGSAVLLTALLAAAGTAVGLGTNLQTAPTTEATARTIGLVGGIVLLVITLISYFAGGYVAGRMARFSGAKQGIGVWLWAVIAAVVVAVLSLVAGAQFNILSSLNGFPRIPVNEGTLTAAGVITAVAVALVALLGAVLGGIAGMRYHRKVDAVGLTD